MPVRFVVGRSGSGKTWRCLEAVRARLREDPVGGSKLLLLVPEQASFQMERALIETPDIHGFIRCEVLSFQRLAYRIFAETGADPRRADETIGPLGRMMAIRRLIRREKNNLRLLGRVADKPGLVRQVSSALDELMRADLEPATLAELAERYEGANPLAAAKLADLTRLYRAYLDYLEDGRLDPAQYLHLAAERLDACTWLNGAEVWVDGFAGFTQQEYVLLVKLAQRAAFMEIALLVDPRASAIEAIELPKTTFSLFARTERTLVRLRRDLTTAGVPIAEPVRLDPWPPPRFVAPELAALEKHLFRTGSPEDTGAAPTAISLLEFPDRRCEVDAAVAEIRRLTQLPDAPLRYRDIAVVVRDLTEYHDLLSASLRAAGVPFFIDRRQPTTNHPLIELVRGLLSVASDDCRLESVRLTLKTGLLPIGDDDADTLENYLLAHGIAGRDAWREPWTFTRMFRRRGRKAGLSDAQKSILNRVNQTRQAWLDAVGPWLETAAAPEGHRGRTWASSLFACLERIGAGGHLERWARDAELDGRSDEADHHRQVWVDFVRFLDEFVMALGGDRMSINEFRETVEAGLAEFDLGLAPPTLDQVLVGAIERSRHPPVRAVLLLGFDEQHFPMRRTEDPLLGDLERDDLDRAGMEIGPSRQRQLLDERMLAYIAMTRAGERLWISYPRAAGDGTPVEPSAYLPDLLAAVPGLRPQRCDDPRLTRTLAGISRVPELAERLAQELRWRPRAPDEVDPAARARWNAIYEAARQHVTWQHTLRMCLSGLAYRNQAKLEPGLMEQAVPWPFAASVSRLERFAACPFAHFAEHTLALEQRMEADLGTLDLGNISHAVLEMFIAELAREGRRLGDLDDDEVIDRIDRTAAELAPKLGGDMMLAEARNAYLFDRSRNHLHRVTQWQRDAARSGRYYPVRTEREFGYRENEKVVITTPRGRRVELHGIIDRVDVVELADCYGAVVIDYKTVSERRLKMAEVYHGLTLQLVGYLLALQQAGESLTGRKVRPVAAFYLPLLQGFETVSHPSKATSPTEAYRFRGILDLTALDGLDTSAASDRKSRYMSAGLTKDGKPHQNSDLASPKEFEAIMAHVSRKMGELADSLLDGNVEVKPYRLNKTSPCKWCPYMAVCRYEADWQPPNTLAPLGRRADILKRLTEEHPDA
ncbi:MAG TPA: PD-(D/E)XK nuclease family protein [Phycisphaerae bacterium]|nr:PD-(D/E)XK nuclease family protein [Phycisphaerae bacterium]HRR84739.1 PD-(D/E)XK nuclease family protein [Phycisphaerae bacterium]